MPTLNSVKPSFLKEVQDMDGRYFYKKTPVGSYTFRFLVDWDGNEKPDGDLVFDSPDWGDQYLTEGSLPEAEKFARNHLKLRLVEKKEEVEQVEEILTLEEQLLGFAKMFRSADHPDDVTAHYRYMLQQAQSMGIIPNPLRLKINRMNKTIGSSFLRGESSMGELEVMAQVMELLAKEARNVSKTASPQRVASLWASNKKRS